MNSDKTEKKNMTTRRANRSKSKEKIKAKTESSDIVFEPTQQLAVPAKGGAKKSKISSVEEL